MKKSVVFGILITGIFLISFGFVSSAPQVEFVDPTPDDGTTTLNTSVEINVSITEANLNEMNFSWNGVNYSFYDDSLVLMMNFDNVSALGENDNLSVDVSKYGNNGTVSGGAVWNSSGKYRGAYEFDGVNDYVEVQDDVSLNFSNGSFSFSVWMNPLTNNAIDIGVLDKGAGDWSSGLAPNYGWYFGSLTTSSKYNFIVSDGDEGVYGDRLPFGDLDNQGWVHVVVTVDSANDDSPYIRGYLNAVNTRIIERTSKSFDSIDTTYNLYIGKSRQYSREFNGTIDEVRIWNRSLSAEEVKQIYYSDFYKYDTDKWNFYTNESSLIVDDNPFYVSASNSSEGENLTEVRTLTLLFKTLSYYDNRQMVVIGTGDDLGSGSFSDDWLPVINMFQSMKVVFSPGVITDQMTSSEWNFLQDEIDEGFISPVSHSVSHLYAPYDNSTFEVCDSKIHMEGNLTLPWQNQFNGSEFMVGWIEPYGRSDDNIRGNLSQCNYLADRMVFLTNISTLSDWNSLDGLYGRQSVNTDDDSDLTTMNNLFDRIYSEGGVYTIYMHPYLHNWTEDDNIPQHLSYIGNRTDVWYVGFGQFYMYHYVEDQLKPVMNISSRNNRKIFAQTNISSTERNKYGLSYPVTYAFSVPHVWNNSFVFYKNLSIDNYTLMTEKTRNEYWIGIDAYRNNLTEHAVYVSKSFPQESNDLYFKIVPVLSTNFNGSTTDLENTELSNLTNLILEKQNYGKINFSEEVNLSAGGDLNTYVNISDSFVSINSTALSELDKSATITLYGITLSNPRIMKDGAVCPSTICTEVNYSGGNYTFTVTGFSNYSLEETPSSTTDDTISGGSGKGTYKPSKSSLENGFSVNVVVGQKVQITYSDGKTNLVEVESVSEEKVVVSVDGVNYEISSLGSGKIDLDDDGFYDVEISNKKVYSNGVANLEFKLIHEEVASGGQEEQKSNVGEVIEDIDWYLYVIIGVVIILIVVGIVLKKRIR